MPSLLARPTLRIAEPDPFGDVTLVPSPLTGKPETEAARTLARDDIAPRPASTPRHSVPAPRSLTARLTTLAALMRR